MEPTLQHKVAEALIQTGCLWTSFEVPLGRGRNRADVVGYGLRDGKEAPLVVAEVKAAVDLSRAKQGMAAAEFLRAPYFLMTDGTTSVWYERTQDDWRRLVSAPQLPGVTKKTLSEGDFAAVLWRCADIVRGQPFRSLWSELEKILAGFMYWSRHQDRFGDAELMLQNPGAILHDALSAMNPAQDQFPAERSNVDPLALGQIVKLLYFARVHEAPERVLLTQMLELRDRAADKSEGESLSPAKLTLAIAQVVSALTPRDGAVLDPTCGSGGFLAATGASRKDLTLVGIDSHPEASRLGAALLATGGGEHAFYSANVLKDGVKDLPAVASVVRQRGGFDTVVFDPPFGMKVLDAEVQRRFEIQSSTAEGLFLERAISLLKPGGYVLMITLPGLLWRGSDRGLRDYLLRETYPEAVLEVPPAFRSQRTAIKTYLMVARKKGPGVEPTPEVMMSSATQADDDFVEVLQKFIAYREGKEGRIG
jgi:tRNA1(Val) A37 N6-methylase TrmN6